MARNYKSRMHTNKTTFGTALGIGVCLLAWALMSAGVALMVSNENIPEISTQWIVPLLQAVITFAGAYVSGRVVNEKKAVAAVLCAVSYLVLLFAVTLLLFDGGLYNPMPVIAAVLIGAMLAILLNYYTLSRTKGRRRARYRK